MTTLAPRKRAIFNRRSVLRRPRRAMGTGMAFALVAAAFFTLGLNVGAAPAMADNAALAILAFAN